MSRNRWELGGVWGGSQLGSFFIWAISMGWGGGVKGLLRFGAKTHVGSPTNALIAWDLVRFPSPLLRSLRQQ